MSIWQYGHVYIHCPSWCLPYLTNNYTSISVSAFDLTFRHLVVIIDFYSAKVSSAGNTASTS